MGKKKGHGLKNRGLSGSIVFFKTNYNSSGSTTGPNSRRPVRSRRLEFENFITIILVGVRLIVTIIE